MHMMSHAMINPLLRLTRRHFFKDCAVGLGGLGLTSLLSPEAFATGPMAAKPSQYPAKAKSVIYLFMAGGPSQLDLFDPKPKLSELNGKPIPDSYLAGKRFAFMNTFAKEKPKLLASSRRFAQHGRSGAWISECLPHTARIADNLTFVRTMQTDVFNHAPAKIFMNTGSAQFGRPSMGSWLTYGIGSESQNLPGFVVLMSGPRGPRGGSALWSSGFLPTTFQGVPFRSGGDPILDLANPPGVSAERQRKVIDAVRDLNEARLADTGDPEIATRISQYETAYRMQSAAPELIDLTREDRRTLDMYGVAPGKSSFATNCLLARRLVERGVRFVQLYHTDWDHHGDHVNNLTTGLDKVCREVDQPSVALVRDLKQRGLLDSTLVIWGGEFGRTPMGEIRDTVGRNHHVDAFTIWLAGGGTKPGITIGETDEFGFSPLSDKVHVHDLHATILHLLGLEHTKLTFRFQGRDFRLTDVSGELVPKLLA
jgi:hypothetical protein